MARQTPKLDRKFAGLTWDRLEDWAGGKIVSRGQSYMTRVRTPALTPDGGLVAWVSGTERYATYVAMSEDGEIQNNCTCPYDWGPCKHAVALVLVGIQALQKKTRLSLVNENDVRLALLDAHLGGGDEWGLDHTVQGAPAQSPTLEKPREQAPLRTVLGELKKAELVELVLGLASRFPEVERKVRDRDRPNARDVKPMVRELRREIKKITSEPAWLNHWNGRGRLPDYSTVCRKLTHLLFAGHPDQVIELGADLWDWGCKQIEGSDDDGETASRIGQCMNVVMQAVKQSSLAPEDRILWFVEADLEDEFNVLGNVEEYLKDGYEQRNWDKAANVLAAMLRENTTSDPDDFSWRFRHKRILGWLTKALDSAGRADEIISLLEREAPLALCYEELLDRLLEAGRTDEARIWAVKGFENTAGRWKGIAWQIVARLMEVARRSEDSALTGSYLAFKFFHDPDVAVYQDMEKAMDQTGLWPQVRQAVLKYLHSGTRPDTASVKGKPDSSTPWPLPELPLQMPMEPAMRNRFPRYDVLFNIAIHENRHDDAVKLYQESLNSKGWFGPSHDEVAKALHTTRPDTAIDAWQHMAQAKISLAKTPAYKVACGYLRKARSLCLETGRDQQWQEYIQALRLKHKAKWRLMQLLDELERAPTGHNRIIDGKL